MRELSLRLFDLPHAVVRLHASFLATGLFFAYAAASAPASGYGPVSAWLTGMGTLFLAVLVHEAGHAAMARAVGGEHEVWVLWPLGGLRNPVLSPWEKDDVVLTQEEALSAMAGPAVNLGLCLLLLPVLMWADVAVTRCLNLLLPPLEVVGWMGFAAMFFWANWLLFVANLLPAFPFDGARATRALLWRSYGGEIAQGGLLIVSRMVGFVLVLAAILVQPYASWTSLPLVFAALMVFKCSEQAAPHIEWDGADDAGELPYERHAGGYDEPQPGRSWRTVDQDDLDDEPSVNMERVSSNYGSESSLEEERRPGPLPPTGDDSADEKRLDELLARIHETGWGGLTEEERRLMLKISDRMRARRPQNRSAAAGEV